MRRLSLAFCGCGSRARTYAAIAAGMADRFALVAAADPVPERVAAIRAHTQAPGDFRSYASAEAMFAAGRPADVVVIGTQDAQHREHAIRAMELGCDLLLEKPIAHRLEDTLAVRDAARRLGRRHDDLDLRRRSLHELIDDGRAKADGKRIVQIGSGQRHDHVAI